MVETTCPWCEAELLLAHDVQVQEQTCPECLTTWAYETASETDMALAA